MGEILALKKTATGQLLARRNDGRPLTEKDRAEAKRLANEVVILPRAWVAETVHDDGVLRAVMICSAVIEAHFWLVVDQSFTPDDNLAIFFPEELEWLRDKSAETLKDVYKTKLVFPGAKVVQP